MVLGDTIFQLVVYGVPLLIVVLLIILVKRLKK